MEYQELIKVLFFIQQQKPKDTSSCNKQVKLSLKAKN